MTTKIPSVVVLVAALFWVSATHAAELPAKGATEIAHLLQHLGASGCEFNRNGDWYNAKDASAHIRKKYDYLLKKGLLGSAEDFIRLGATESSMSHQAYQVRCGAQVEPSADWMSEELERFRSSKGAVAP
jgi:hypothetical protein